MKPQVENQALNTTVKSLICAGRGRLKNYFEWIEIYFVKLFISEPFQAPGPKQLMSFPSGLLWSLPLMGD